MIYFFGTLGPFLPNLITPGECNQHILEVSAQLPAIFAPERLCFQRLLVLFGRFVAGTFSVSRFRHFGFPPFRCGKIGPVQHGRSIGKTIEMIKPQLLDYESSCQSPIYNNNPDTSQTNTENRLLYCTRRIIQLSNS